MRRFFYMIWCLDVVSLSRDIKGGGALLRFYSRTLPTLRGFRLRLLGECGGMVPDWIFDCPTLFPIGLLRVFSLLPWFFLLSPTQKGFGALFAGSCFAEHRPSPLALFSVYTKKK